MSIVNVYNKNKRCFEQADYSQADRLLGKYRADELYVAPPFIDIHQHVNCGGGILSIDPDLGGLRKGVHLVVDAGSTGFNNYKAFRDFIVPAKNTPVKAFLNISAIGLASPQPYHDMRLCDPEQCAQAIIEDSGRFLVGVKVLTSRVRVEDSLCGPIRLARKAADLAGCPMMAHHAEGPPMNDETLCYMKTGDIVTHCFHGDKYPEPNPLFKQNGEPIQALREALDRGVLLDVGHGTSSMNSDVAKKAISAGIRDFTISTDLHSLNINGPVYGLPETMSKFFDLGLSLDEIVDAVTYKAYKAVRLDGWGEDLENNCTIFVLNEPPDDQRTIRDSQGNRIEIKHLIKPIAVVMQGSFIELDLFDKTS